MLAEIAISYAASMLGDDLTPFFTDRCAWPLAATRRLQLRGWLVSRPAGPGDYGAAAACGGIDDAEGEVHPVPGLHGIPVGRVLLRARELLAAADMGKLRPLSFST